MAAPKKSSDNEQKIQGYQIRARGQYYTREKTLKFYDLTFFIPKEVEIQVRREWKWFKSGKSKIKRSVPVYDKVNGRENAQYIIQRLLLPSELAEKYQDALAAKTCRIGESKLAQGSASQYADISKKPISKMSKPELMRFCKLHSLDTPIDNFADIEDARQAVQDSFDDVRFAGAKKDDPDADLMPVEEEDDPASGPGDGEKVEDVADDLLK